MQANIKNRMAYWNSILLLWIVIKLCCRVTSGTQSVLPFILSTKFESELQSVTILMNTSGIKALKYQFPIETVEMNQKQLNGVFWNLKDYLKFFGALLKFIGDFKVTWNSMKIIKFCGNLMDFDMT